MIDARVWRELIADARAGDEGAIAVLQDALRESYEHLLDHCVNDIDRSNEGVLAIEFHDPVAVLTEKRSRNFFCRRVTACGAMDLLAFCCMQNFEDLPTTAAVVYTKWMQFDLVAMVRFNLQPLMWSDWSMVLERSRERQAALEKEMYDETLRATVRSTRVQGSEVAACDREA